jgi:hypothetical protein
VDSLVLQKIVLWKALPFFWNDSMCEIVSIVMACVLAAFLCERPPYRDFASLRFQIATSMIPLIIALFYKKKPLGCLQGTAWQEELSFLQLPESSTSVRMRGFPVVVIFHAMVTASIWFMIRQRKHHTLNVALVEKLRKEMSEMKTNANRSQK